jgi:transcriptional regulator with GAF, ATPase, and Fis domain
MPIDRALLATSIRALADLDPEPDLPASLQRAVTAAKQLFNADAAGITLTDATGELHWASPSDQRSQAVENNQETLAIGPCAEAFTTGRPAAMYDAYQERRRGGPWGEITLAIADLEARSALSAPIDLGDGPIGTLDLYATNPRGWEHNEVSALETYAGVVARLLGAAAKAHLTGRLADQLQVALDSRCSSRLRRADGGATPERP